MSRKLNKTVVLGATPRADLLPPSVKEAIRRRPIVRRLMIMVFLVAVVTILVVFGATLLEGQARVLLTQEQARSQTLLLQQLEFAEARAISGAVDETLAARAIATAREADWNALLSEIRATLPQGVLLVSVAGEIRAADTGEEIPLRQNSVGSFTIKAISDTVPNIEAWIADLETLTGFAGIAPPVTITGGEGSVYAVSIEVLLDETAFLQRYALDIPEGSGSPTQTEEEEG
jgi:hypothetical protein